MTLFRFGGTNGERWFSDVWEYSSAYGWRQLDCAGQIPQGREGHAAAVVDGVMYVFGGRDAEGSDLGDLIALSIASRRWYTFQNMGPSPSPRSGHRMCVHKKKIHVVGGERGNNWEPGIQEELLIYTLDTSKIRFPVGIK